MSLTLTDIAGWDDASIDQVFAAATSRAEGAETTGNTVGDLLSFVRWNGLTADAARDSASRIKITLGNHADACKNVAAAARKAAAEVADLKYRLSMIRAEADEAQLTIDNQTGAVTSKPTVLTVQQQNQQDALKKDVEAKVKQLLADAATADRDLATAIQTADGAATGGPAGAPPPKLPKPPPDSASPADVKKWWDSLTPQQQTGCVADNPAAIDRDGIPTDSRDAGNRIRLPHEIAQAQATLRQSQGDEGRYWQYAYTHEGQPPPGMTDDPVRALANAQGRLNDLTGIQNAIYPTNSNGTPKVIDPSDRRTLIHLDSASNSRHVFGVIGIGDVDNARHVGVTTGGVSTSAASLPNMADEATNLKHTTSAILAKAGDPNAGSVAAIAWVGYEPPSDMADLRVTSDDLARAAAPRLNSFFNGLAAITDNPHQEITAFGHSYGSLVTSLALQDGSPVKNVVFYGSPGLELNHATDLHLAPGGHAYYELTPDDPIRGVQRPLVDIPYVGPALDWLLTGGLPSAMPFGATPDELANLTQLSTAPGPDPMHIDDHRAGSSGHSEYPRDDGNGQLRMSGYNLAAVLSGVASAPEAGN